MNTTGNTILITGGGSGIGCGLAQAFHALGNQVVIAGRRKQALDETTKASPGMKAFTVDMLEAASICSFAAKVVAEFPSINVLINNAGIMRAEKLLSQQPTSSTPRQLLPLTCSAPFASQRHCCLTCKGSRARR